MTTELMMHTHAKLIRTHNNVGIIHYIRVELVSEIIENALLGSLRLNSTCEHYTGVYNGVKVSQPAMKNAHMQTR